MALATSSRAPGAITGSARLKAEISDDDLHVARVTLRGDACGGPKQHSIEDSDFLQVPFFPAQHLRFYFECCSQDRLKPLQFGIRSGRSGIVPVDGYGHLLLDALEVA